MAGDPFGLTPAEFLGIRLGVALVFAVLALLISVLLGQGLAFIGIAMLGGALFGYVIPAFFLGNLIRDRRKRIRKALPASLDMLAISVEAGLSLDGALAQVAQKWQNPLSEELRRVLVDFQMGRQRSDALLELGRRCNVQEVSRFVNAVVQADNFGVPLSRVLHDQADEARTRRRQRAEELARTAPVKMIFPMVLLIFPALFIVILGPAVPRVLEIFGTTH
jgi:tight adherence protein C